MVKDAARSSCLTDRLKLLNDIESVLRENDVQMSRLRSMVSAMQKSNEYQSRPRVDSHVQWNLDSWELNLDSRELNLDSRELHRELESQSIESSTHTRAVATAGPVITANGISMAGSVCAAKAISDRSRSFERLSIDRVSVPPGMAIWHEKGTGLLGHQEGLLCICAANAAAVAPDPHARVTPAPRSCTTSGQGPESLLLSSKKPRLVSPVTGLPAISIRARFQWRPFSRSKVSKISK
jgi:hypothetical protein